MHPVAYRALAMSGLALSYFTFVVREFQIHPPSVDIELVTEVFSTHHSTLQVPAGEAIPPRRSPTHDMSRRSFLPQGKILRIALFSLSVEVTGIGKELFYIATRKFPIVQSSPVVFEYVKIYRTVAFVSKTIF